MRFPSRSGFPKSRPIWSSTLQVKHDNMAGKSGNQAGQRFPSHGGHPQFSKINGLVFTGKFSPENPMIFMGKSLWCPV